MEEGGAMTMTNAAIIIALVAVIVGFPIALMRAATSQWGQQFLRWCLHWDDDDAPESRP